MQCWSEMASCADRRRNPLTDLAGSQLRFVINVIRKSLSFQRICLNSVSPSENFSRTAMKIAGRLFSAYDGARCEHMGAQDARSDADRARPTPQSTGRSDSSRIVPDCYDQADLCASDRARAWGTTRLTT